MNPPSASVLVYLVQVSPPISTPYSIVLEEETDPTPDPKSPSDKKETEINLIELSKDFKNYQNLCNYQITI